jgi:outer membrane protein assembly factor BamB
MVFVNNNNSPHAPLDLRGADAYLKPVPNQPGTASPPAAADGGLCAALSAWDGTVAWTFTNPALDANGRNGWSLSPMTVANGVVLYASMDPAGTLFLLRAADGALLGSYTLGASSACGPAVVNGVVFAGTGYSNFALGSPGTRLVALAAPPA